MPLTPIQTSEGLATRVDESRRSFEALAEEAQRTEAGRSDAVVVVQQAAFIALNDLGPVVGKSRVLCEGLWGRAFLTAYNSASDRERLRMAKGLDKGAGVTLLAIPMVEVFKFTQAQFQRILSNYLEER